MTWRALERTNVHSWRSPDGPELLWVPLDPRGQPGAALQPGLLSNGVPPLGQPPQSFLQPRRRAGSVTHSACGGGTES